MDGSGAGRRRRSGADRGGTAPRPGGGEEADRGGTDVDSATRYGATALFFACDKGSVEMVDYLLEKGASVNITDTFYQASPLTWALFEAEGSADHRAIVLRLLAAGAERADAVLGTAVHIGAEDAGGEAETAGR